MAATSVPGQPLSAEKSARGSSPLSEKHCFKASSAGSGNQVQVKRASTGRLADLSHGPVPTGS